MIYDIKLRISYDYAHLAAVGRHVACILPRDLGAGQRLIAGLLDITPRPSERVDRVDFFGNRLSEFGFRNPHLGLALTMTARIDRNDLPPQMADSVALADLPRAIAGLADLGPDSALHYLSPSVRVPPDPAMTAFARAHLTAGMTVAEAVLALNGALYRHMTFDAKATHVDTPASEAFAKRHGVCQDFSHILITCLRGIGIPAGYVSGFLRTLPPPGKPRLEGADAMHAWVRAWCGPRLGWIEVDPTNNKLAGLDHIVVARGRDYSDVAPIKGVMRGSGRQKSRQAVDVVPVAG
ncbi:MAG: transglutaminase family protein [Pseudomonadota bacterium]